MPIRVALLDDDDRFRGRLADRLGFFDELEIVVQARSARGLIEQIEKLATPPDVALLDIELPESSGIEVARELTASYPDINVLMLTVFEDADNVFDAVRAGASGYLLKDAEASDIVHGVLDVNAGGAPLSRTVARRILNSVRDEKQRTTPKKDSETTTPDLSARELELLDRIVVGETEAEIALRLGISPHTVRTHVKNIYRKLQVRSRAAAVRVTLERGILDR